MKVLMLIDDLGVGGAQTHVAVLARGLCPPDKVVPRSPIIVSMPSGSSAIISCK